MVVIIVVTGLVEDELVVIATVVESFIFEVVEISSNDVVWIGVSSVLADGTVVESVGFVVTSLEDDSVIVTGTSVVVSLVISVEEVDMEFVGRSAGLVGLSVAGLRI